MSLTGGTGQKKIIAYHCLTLQFWKSILKCIKFLKMVRGFFFFPHEREKRNQVGCFNNMHAKLTFPRPSSSCRLTNCFWLDVWLIPLGLKCREDRRERKLKEKEASGMEKLGELDRGMKGEKRSAWRWRREIRQGWKTRKAQKDVWRVSKTKWGRQKKRQYEGKGRYKKRKKDRQRKRGKWLDFSLLCMDQGESSLFNPIYLRQR